ncbi:MAG: GNAT family N-acetyltransferase [Actinomycetota bacterium]
MTASLAELEDAALSSWPAAEVERIGGWGLGASGGFTSRANSVHVGGDIDPHDLDARLAAVDAFYGERGLQPRIQVPLPHVSLLDGLRTRSWETRPGADVLVGPLPTGAGDTGDVEVLDRPEDLLDVWWSVNRAAAERSVESAALLRRVEPPVAFALARLDGRPVACGVGTVRGTLLGVSAMATLPPVRGRGLGRRVLGALSAWAGGLGATTCWLQVAPGNEVAIGLYRSLGLRRSYGYVYVERSS